MDSPVKREVAKPMPSPFHVSKGILPQNHINIELFWQFSIVQNVGMSMVYMLAIIKSTQFPNIFIRLHSKLKINIFWKDI